MSNSTGAYDPSVAYDATPPHASRREEKEFGGMTISAKAPPGASPFKDVPCRYRAVARGNRGALYLYGIIGGDWFGEGITSQRVADSLKAMGNVTTIDVSINSPGGDVFEGRGIYNLLKDHGAIINVDVIAEASSAASLIAMAGETIRMAEGALMMIHRASGLVYGNVDECLKLVDLLRVVDDTLVKTYAARTKNSEAEIRAWLDAETWMTADEAVARGFATEAAAPAKVAALASPLASPLALDRRLLGFKRIPQALRPNRAAALALINGAGGSRRTGIKA